VRVPNTVNTWTNFGDPVGTYNRRTVNNEQHFHTVNWADQDPTVLSKVASSSVLRGGVHLDTAHRKHAGMQSHTHTHTHSVPCNEREGICRGLLYGTTPAVASRCYRLCRRHHGGSPTWCGWMGNTHAVTPACKSTFRPLLLSDFNQKCYVSTNFRKTRQQTDRHAEENGPKTHENLPRLRFDSDTSNNGSRRLTATQTC
jgi:hypothetical protein